MMIPSLTDAMHKEFLAAFWIIVEGEQITQDASGLKQEFGAVQKELDGLLERDVDLEANESVEAWRRADDIKNRAEVLRQRWEANRQQLSAIEQRIAASTRTNQAATHHTTHDEAHA